MMKKLTALLLLCTSLLSCTHSGDTVPVPDAVLPEFSDVPVKGAAVTANPWSLQYGDGFLYLSAVSGMGINSPDNTDLTYTVKRINPSTGKVSDVCPDPLCGHNTKECPFYGLDSMPIGFADGKLFYRRSWITDIDAEANLVNYYSADMVYDIASGNLTELMNLNGERGGINCELYTDTHRYWYRYVWNDDGSDGRYCLYRASYDKLKPELLADVSYEEAMFVGWSGDSLYFTDGKILYATDADFQNRRTIAEGDFTYGRYWFGGDSVYWRDANNRIFRILLSTGETADTGITAETLKITENWIYYTSPEEAVLGKARIYGYAASEVIVTGEHLYRCAHDGSGSEKIFTFDGELSTMRLQSFETVENCIWATYVRWDDPDGDSIFRDGAQYESSHDGRLLRIDVTTGETSELVLP